MPTEKTNRRAARSRARKRGDQNGDKIPDTLRPSGRVRLLVGKLQESQSREEDIKFTRQMNGHEWDDPCPGAAGKSYTEAVEEFQAQQRRLLEANPKLRKQVDGYLMALADQAGEGDEGDGDEDEAKDGEK